MLKLNNTFFDISDNLDIVTDKLLNSFTEIFPFVIERDEYFNRILIRIINNNRHILLIDDDIALFLESVVTEVSKEIQHKDFIYKILRVNKSIYLLSLSK